MRREVQAPVIVRWYMRAVKRWWDKLRAAVRLARRAMKVEPYVTYYSTWSFGLHRLFPDDLVLHWEDEKGPWLTVEHQLLVATREEDGKDWFPRWYGVFFHNPHDDSWLFVEEGYQLVSDPTMSQVFSVAGQ